MVGKVRSKRKTQEQQNESSSSSSSSSAAASSSSDSDHDESSDNGCADQEAVSWLSDTEWQALHKEIRPQKHTLQQFRTLVTTGALETEYKKPELEKLLRALREFLTTHGRFSAQYGIGGGTSMTKKTISERITALALDSGGTPAMATPGAASGGAIRRKRQDDDGGGGGGGGGDGHEGNNVDPKEHPFPDGGGALLFGASESASSLQRRRPAAPGSTNTSASKNFWLNDDEDDSSFSPDDPLVLAQTSAKKEQHRKQQQQRQQQKTAAAPPSSSFLGENSVSLICERPVEPAPAVHSSMTAQILSQLDKFRSPLMEFRQIVHRLRLWPNESAGQFELPGALRDPPAVDGFVRSRNIDARDRIVLIPVKESRNGINTGFEPERWPVPPKETLKIRINNNPVPLDYKKNWPETRSGGVIERSYLAVDITRLLTTKDPEKYTQTFWFDNRTQPQLQGATTMAAVPHVCDIIICLVRVVDPAAAAAGFLRNIMQDTRKEINMKQLLRQQYERATASADEDDDDIMHVAAAAAAASAAANGGGGTNAAGSAGSVDQQQHDVRAIAAQVSTRCSVSRMPIKIPVRSVHCTHLQCVDFATHIRTCHVQCFWNCPQCDRPMRINHIVVDPIIEALITEAGGCPGTYSLHAAAAAALGNNKNNSAAGRGGDLASRCGVQADWILMRQSGGNSFFSSDDDDDDDDDDSNDDDDDDGGPSSHRTGGHTTRVQSQASNNKLTQSRRNDDDDDDVVVSHTSSGNRPRNALCNAAKQTSSASVNNSFFKLPPSTQQQAKTKKMGSNNDAGALLRLEQSNSSRSASMTQSQRNAVLRKQSKYQLSSKGNSRDDAIALD